MKRIIAIMMSIVILSVTICTHFIPGVVSADDNEETIASYSLKSASQQVSDDPRFDSVMTFSPGSTGKRIVTFSNGVNDWSHADLSSCLGVESEDNRAVVNFYVRSTRAVTVDICFFHTLQSVYAETSRIPVEIKTADQWTEVSVEMKNFKYTSSSDRKFSRFDIIYESGDFGGDDVLEISTVKILSQPPTEYNDADGIMFESNKLSLKKKEYKTLVPIFTSSLGGIALPAEVTWKSSNEAVAVVDANGKVSAVSDGTAFVTCFLSETVFASVEITVSGELVSEEVYRFWSETDSEQVEGDPRFDSVMNIAVGENTKSVVLFSNGINDWVGRDLSRYIGKTPIESMAVLSFYIKTNYSGDFKVRFFHTKDSVYLDTSSVTVVSNGDEKWQLVNIPMSAFTYSESDLFFGRADLIFTQGSFEQGDVLNISPLKILTSQGSAYYEADGFYFKKSEITMKQKQTATTELVFTTTKKGEALPIDVKYSCSDSSVIKIDEKGKLRALKNGSAIVRAESKDGLFAECRVVVNGVGEITELASFSRDDIHENVSGDPRFDYIMSPKITEASERFAFFYNGKNDWQFYDFSNLIGKEPINSEAVLSFYIKTTYSGKLNAVFFHTKDSVYAETSKYTFTVDGSNEWKLVNIPMSSFTYAQTDKNFARFDILVSKGALSENDTLKISRIKVLSYAPEEYYPAENFYLPNNSLTVKINQFVSLNPIFTSSKGTNVIPDVITWTSSNTEVVKVNADNTVLGCSQGQAVITGKMANGQTAVCNITVSGIYEITEIASFTLTSNESPTFDDPRFDSIMTHQVGLKSKSVSLFANGKNDWSHVDFRKYIGKEPIYSGAYLYFYIRSPKAGKFYLRFFHTYNGVYVSTNQVLVNVKEADIWQAVEIPLSLFTYKGSDDFYFARCDIVFSEGFFDDGDKLKLSPVKLLSSRPVIPSLVKAEKMVLNYSSYSASAETALQLKTIFSASSGTAAPEEVEWICSNENATVSDNGYVKLYKSGKVTVTAVSESGFKASCDFIVGPRGESIARWSMGTGYSYSSNNLLRSVISEEGDPRFEKYFALVKTSENNHTIQLFQSGSVTGDISDCLDFGVMRFWIKVPKNNTAFTISLTCNRGDLWAGSNGYKCVIKNSDGWQRIEIPISEFTFPSGFDYTAVKFVSISGVDEAKLNAGEYNVSIGDTLKIAGLTVFNHSPADPAAPKYAPVKSVNFIEDYITITQGDRYRLEYQINPEDADSSVTFVNKHPNVISVSADGVVLAKKSGTYTIDIVTDSGKKTDTATIVVNPLDPEEPSKCIFEVNFTKGQWSDAKDGAALGRTENLEKDNENYYRFKRIHHYGVAISELYYSSVNGHFTMYYGDMVSSDHPSYNKLNIEPYIETATLRFWVRAPRAGIRMMVGFNEYSYGTVKYNYSISKANEWIEMQIPIKDILAKNPGFNVNELRHLIISVATDETKDSQTALKDGESVEFGYFQIWTKEPQEPVYVEVDNSRYFYDETDDKVWIVDKDLILPQLTGVRFVFDSENEVFDYISKALKPCKAITLLDIYAFNLENGRKYTNDSLFASLELRIKTDHSAFTGADINRMGVCVCKDGKIQLIESCIEDECLVVQIDSYDKLVFVELTDDIISRLQKGEKIVFETMAEKDNGGIGIWAFVMAGVSIAVIGVLVGIVIIKRKSLKK